MAEHETARKLAQAAFAAARVSDISLFDAAVKSATADDIARAYALSLTEKDLDGSEKHRLILREYLQVKLMHEHVAAQKRMGTQLTLLTWALVIFTLALVWFGYVDYSKKHEGVQARPPTHFVPDAPQPAVPPAVR